MATEIRLPDLGEEIESADVLEILVAEGDVVEVGQGLVELETEKATATIDSTHAGIIAKIAVSEGETVGSGALLFTLETDDAASSAPAAEPPAPPAQEATEEAEVAEPAKPPAPLPAPPATEPPAPAETKSPPPARAPAAGKHSVRIAAGPAIRRFAREVGVDLARVKGTGPSSRITRDDVLQVVREASQAATGAAAAPATSAKPTGKQQAALPAPGDPGNDAWGPVRVERMSKIRKTIAAKMHESWSTVPRVTNFDDADVTELERIRQSSKADYAMSGIRLTSMPFVIKAVALSLRAHPAVNASLDMEAGQIIYKDYVNVGIAVDTDRGLVVPALRGAAELSIADIARRLAEMAENVRSGSFTLDDLRGGTFTISNLGAIGGTYSTPIVNIPEVSVLLLGRSRQLPVVVEGEVAVRLMMPLSLSYDHRLVDGATAARFLNEVIGYLEAPSRLLLAP